MRQTLVSTKSRSIHQFLPDGSMPWITLHDWRIFQPHLILLNIFDLDPRKTLQEIWLHQDVDSISRSNDCVLKSLCDVNKSSNDIP